MPERQLGAGAQVRQTVEVISGKAQPLLNRCSPQMGQGGDGGGHGKFQPYGSVIARSEATWRSMKGLI
jgi:hypothetical protein